MSINRVKDYLKKYGLESRIIELQESSATVKDAAIALHTNEDNIAKSLAFVVDNSVKSESIPEQSVNSDEVIREVILPPEDEIYDFVEKSPSYPGGIPALKEYLKENLNFPEDTKRWDRVISELVIDTDGSIIRKRYDNSAEPAVIEEIIRVIDAMPKWNPGKHKGKIVKARYVLPIFSDKKKYEN